MGWEQDEDEEEQRAQRYALSNNKIIKFVRRLFCFCRKDNQTFP
jgi:hypothetical protein